MTEELRLIKMDRKQETKRHKVVFYMTFIEKHLLFGIIL